MGTTFQGIQISTLPLTEESARHHQSVPAVDMVASWHILGEYGCTLITESRLYHRSTQYVWSINGTDSPSIQDHLNLGITPKISTLISHQGFPPTPGFSLRVSTLGISPRVTTLGISPRVTLLASHQESPPLGISPRVPGSRHLTKILNLASRQVASTWSGTKIWSTCIHSQVRLKPMWYPISSPDQSMILWSPYTNPISRQL